MSDTAPENEAALDPEELRSHAEHLERELAQVRKTAEQRVIWADLTVEAVRAGMVDLDGIKLLGNGELDRKLTLKVHAVSEGAKAKVEAAGGSVEILGA